MNTCAVCGAVYATLKIYGLHYICTTCASTIKKCKVCREPRANLVDGICFTCRVVGFSKKQVEEETLCKKCGQHVVNDCSYITEDGVICEECYRKGKYRACVRCLTQHKGNDIFCNKCLSIKHTCADCGEVFFKEDIEGPVVCVTCHRHYKKCSYCGKHSRGVYYGHCEDCRHKIGFGVEFSWRYRPHKFIKHGNSKDVMFGIENEVEVSTDKEGYIRDIAKNYHPSVAYTMYDGTINYGTEVVFHPHTLEAIKKLDVKRHLKNVIPSENTGMHVHIDKGSFVSKVHLYKFMRFISENPVFIQKIARRKPTNRGWCFTDKRFLAGKVAGTTTITSKYVDINLKHKDTVEVRIFKGATTERTFYKNVEFCHALLVYSKVNNVKSMADVTKFAHFVFSKKDEYEYLTKTLKRFGYEERNRIGVGKKDC